MEIGVYSTMLLQQETVFLLYSNDYGVEGLNPLNRNDFRKVSKNAMHEVRRIYICNEATISTTINSPIYISSV